MKRSILNPTVVMQAHNPEECNLYDWVVNELDAARIVVSVVELASGPSPEFVAYAVDLAQNPAGIVHPGQPLRIALQWSLSLNAVLAVLAVVLWVS